MVDRLGEKWDVWMVVHWVARWVVRKDVTKGDWMGVLLGNRWADATAD